MSDHEALGALLDADRWIERVSFQRNHLAEADELEAVESVLRAEAAALRDAQAAAAPARVAYEEASERADRLQRRRRELETALAVSTASSRDLTAMQHELASVIVQSERDDEVALGMLVEVEERDAAIEALREVARANAARRESLRVTVDELRATLDDEIAVLRATRATHASAVSGPLLDRYERARARAGTSGASRVVEGRCDGCRIALAPLDADRVRALADDEFMECPSCGRLLLR